MSVGVGGEKGKPEVRTTGWRRCPGRPASPTGYPDDLIRLPSTRWRSPPATSGWRPPPPGTPGTRSWSVRRSRPTFPAAFLVCAVRATPVDLDLDLAWFGVCSLGHGWQRQSSDAREWLWCHRQVGGLRPAAGQLEAVVRQRQTTQEGRAHPEWVHDRTDVLNEPRQCNSDERAPPPGVPALARVRTRVRPGTGAWLPPPFGPAPTTTAS